MGCTQGKAENTLGYGKALKLPEILTHRDPANMISPSSSSLRVQTQMQTPMPAQHGLLLTMHQQHLVRTTWVHIERDMANIGKQLFLCIFNQNAGVKDLFPFRDVWGDELLQHPQFMAHTLRFMAVIQGAVRAVHNLEESYAPALVGLGARHTRIQGFTPELFMLFHSSMLVVFSQHLGELMTPEMMHAWRLILEFTVRKLQQGYFGQAKMDQIIEEIDVGSRSPNSADGQLIGEEEEEEEVEEEE